MAGKTAAIKVNILGDAKGFSGALSKAESKLSNFGKKAMKAGGLMTAGLTLPIVGAGVAAFKAAEDFDKAYDTIRIGTGATGETLEGLKDTFKNVLKTVPASFEDTSMAVADLNTRLGLTGPDLEIVSRQVLELSRITGEDLSQAIEGTTRVMGDWGKQGTDIMHGMDDLFKVSQATGISVTSLSDQLVKYGAPLRQMGFDFETSAALLGKFEKEGVNAELVMGSLRQALGKMARTGEPAVETFQRVTEEIKNAGSTSEANAIALELFGARAGPDMAAAIREGRFEVADLVSTLDASGESIIGAAEDTKSFSERLQEFKNRVLVSLEPLMMKLFDAVGGLLDKVAPKIENLVNWFTELSPTTQKVIAVVLALVAAAGPLLMIIGSIAAGLGVLMSPVTLVIAAIAALVAAFIYFYKTNEGFKKWVDDLVVTIRDGLVAAFNWVKDVAIPALADAFRWFVENIWPKVVGAFQWLLDNVWPKIAGFFTWLATDAVPAVIAAFGWLVGAVQTAADGIRVAWDWIWEKVAAFIGWWQEHVWPVISEVLGFLSTAFNQLWHVIQFVWDGILLVVRTAIDFIRAAIESFVGFVGPIWSGLWSGVSNIVGGAWNIITSIVEGALGVIRGIIGFFTGIIKGDWGKVWDSIKQIASSVWNAISGIIGGAVQMISGIIRSVWGGISGFISGVWNTIRGAAEGAWNGIISVISNAMSWVSGVVRGTLDGIVGFFRSLPGRIRSMLSNIANVVSWPFRQMGNAIKNVWNSTIGGRGFTVPDFPGIPRRGERIEIPRLHTGGLVMGGLGVNEQLAILEAGETVRSRRQEAELQSIIGGLLKGSGGDAVTVNFYGPVAGADVATWVADSVEDAVSRGHQMRKLRAAL